MVAYDILYELYEKTRLFENWEQREQYNSFDEAESDFFETINKAKEFGVNHISDGGSRDVYTGGEIAGDKYVIKVARSGLRQNRNAVEIMSEIPDELKPYIASVEKWGNNYEWIIQERASGRGDTRKVGEMLAKHGFSVSDLNGENVSKSLKTGNSVLIDLGLLKK